MAWGLEARVPFLDKAFLEVAMNVDPREKQFSKGASQKTDEDGRPRMEKYILRKAFDVSPDGKVTSRYFPLLSRLQAKENSRVSCVLQPYLPKSILWRQKEQFSDGVGYSWIDGLKGHSETAVSDEDFARRSERWPEGTPDTKEAYHIRDIFDGALPSTSSFLVSRRILLCRLVPF
jgi:asparagine synthase (glutamine-hydrolysing)